MDQFYRKSEQVDGLNTGRKHAAQTIWEQAAFSDRIHPNLRCIERFDDVLLKSLKSKLHRWCAAGFAIGSPISLRSENASDQVRVVLGLCRYVWQVYYMENP